MIDFMKSCRLLLGGLALALVAAGPVRAAGITGAGATFPYPVYAKWAEAYQRKSGLNMNYQSIGSGGGIKQIQARTVDFGASDMPLAPAELEKNGLVQWPQIMGGVVPVVNVEGVKAGALRLTGPVLADIYLGRVAKWNDPAIAQLNPDLKLPNQAIAVVHRSDGSGTTFLFTDYLSKVSPEWRSKVGSSTAVQWPAGIGGKGNEGVANFAAQTPGAIGYVEYAYALQNKLAFAQLRNRDGNDVLPSSKTFQAAAANADWAGTPGFNVVLTDEPGQDSWPITGASFILMPKSPEDPQRAREALQFFSWAFAQGDRMAEELDYVPIPDQVVQLVESMWTRDMRAPATSGAAQGAPLWPAR